jgi:hypothetical protein
MAALIGVSDLYGHGNNARIELSAARPGRGFYPLAAVRVLAGEHEGHWWYPLESDLRAFGGERVTLRLAAYSDSRFEDDTWAFWGSPRVALPPGAEPARGPE